MRTALIAGTWDDQKGLTSSYMTKIIDSLRLTLYVNGGQFKLLPEIIDSLHAYDVLYWFPNISNDKPKLINEIKKRYPRLILVNSKRNMEYDGDRYTLADITARSIAVKANLTLILSGYRNHILGSVIDPLGMYYCDDEEDPQKVAEAMRSRVKRLLEFTRVPSEQIGPAIPVPTDQPFFDYVKEQAGKFHDIIHGLHHTRMMGNASFRCERGFPSMRKGDVIYVSRRNVDKRYIGPDSFVSVAPTPTYSGFFPVQYYGPNKPSVDTGIQLLLYRYYERIYYMIHSHTYIEGAPMTREPIPCGAIEEAIAIKEVEPHRRCTCFAVNLKGHGSIALSGTVEGLRRFKWIPRPDVELYEY